MKTIRRLYRISITSATAFILSIFLFMFFMIIILELKDLSLQAWKTKSAWNELSAVTDDILFLNFDSIQHLFDLKEKWFIKTKELDETFKLLIEHPQLKILTDPLRAELVHAGYIWRFSKKRIHNAYLILDEITDEKQSFDLLLSTGKPSLYENIQELSSGSAVSFEEKSYYRIFTANMSVFDMTKDEFQNILHMINSEIPQIIERKIVTLITCSLLLFILTILYTFISLGRTAKPIIRLADAMKNIGKMDYQMTILSADNGREEDEIAIINKGIHEMGSRIKNLYDKNLLIEKDRQEARLKALQYQINPHFLYNTLGSIQLAASIEKQDRLADAIKSLSCLFRKAIKNSCDLATIADELSMIDDYLNIMQFRYNDRLVVTKRIASDLYSLFIPGRIIQPLLENAIQHGLNEKLNGDKLSAEITITGKSDGKHLYLKIIDNGVGMDEETIQKVLTGQSQKDNNHIGLMNINQRIKLRFGDAYGIKIESLLNESTEITLLLPLIGNNNE